MLSGTLTELHRVLLRLVCPGEVIMPWSYPAEFRRKVVDLVEAGRPVAEVAEHLGVTGRTIYDWSNRGWAQKTTSRSALSGEPSHRRSR